MKNDKENDKDKKKLTFEEKVKLLKETRIDLSMSYEERLRRLKIRYGL